MSEVAPAIKPEEVILPAGGVAIFGRTGSGKSSILYRSTLIGCVIVADTGSLAHKLHSGGEVLEINAEMELSPIQQVANKVRDCIAKKVPWALDSFSTLQEQQVSWFKRTQTKDRGKMSGRVTLQDHQVIVGNLRDLALLLAQNAGFTLFNTAPGGKGKAPDGTEIIYPAGCLTGYPALNGTNANSETILARWGNVWGTFTGSMQHDMPRGLYVPGKDIRPEAHQTYAPLKDPLFVIADNTGKGIMAVPPFDPSNNGPTFLDGILATIASKYGKRPPASVPATQTRGEK
jgi:hypothetical protein